MIATEPYFVLQQKWEEAVPGVVQRLAQTGYRVMCTFDLLDARAGQAACSCPHHGTDQCDCQMMVLLVYGMETQPVSLVVHSYDEMTWFYVVNTPQQRVDARSVDVIQQSLIPVDIPLRNDEPANLV